MSCRGGSGGLPEPQGLGGGARALWGGTDRSHGHVERLQGGKDMQMNTVLDLAATTGRIRSTWLHGRDLYCTISK